MKNSRNSAQPGSNECANDALPPHKLAALHMRELQEQIKALDDTAPGDERLRLTLDKCYALLQGHLFKEAWEIAREVLDSVLTGESWMYGVEACDIMYQSQQEQSIKALAHGIWLGVTFPVDPELSVAMLQHLIDESPDRSDGSAVAAATACYLVELRAEGKQRDDLSFFTQQMLGQVARRHSQVEEQEIFDFWIQQLELDDPGKFLPRLARVLDLLVDGDWWFDKEELRGRIPA